MAHFTHEQIANGLFRIRDVSFTASYLLMGKEKTVLLDTGIGLFSLKEYIASAITARPVDQVILTHGHFDHANGAGEFADVPIYLNPLDQELMRHHADPDKRLAYTEKVYQMTGYPLPEVRESDIIPAFDPAKTLPLADGQIFDLGGLTIKAIHAPGHTQGMTMLLLPELRTILFGDGCGISVLLVEDCCSTVEVYRESLLHVKALEPQYDRVIRNHGSCESPKELLDNVIDVCDEILTGTDDHIPEQVPLLCDAPVYRAKAVQADGQTRVDGKEGNILYAENKVR